MTFPLPGGPTRRTLLTAALAFPLLRHASADTPTNLRIGIMSGEDEDIWRLVAAHAAKLGLVLKVSTFSDYNAPDEALAEHELDANAFQHRPFLDAQITAHGYKIVPVGETYLSPIGLYSTKYPSVASLPHGATIGVPNDPSNEGRSLRLLQTLGLIKLAAGAPALPTALDIADNPRSLTIRELDPGIVGRALQDMDAAVVNTDWAVKSGIDVTHRRIGQESATDNPHVNFIAVNASDANAPWVAPLVASYHQPDVRQAILSLYHGAILPAW